MCDPGPYIKLCTCGNVDESEPHWVLRRGSSLINVPVIMGVYVGSGGSSFDSEKFLINKITFDLNFNPVFDFEYSPVDGDTLQIIISDINLDVTFAVYGTEWREEEKKPSGGKTVHSGDIRFNSWH